jgi:hypothetical protein
MARLYVTGLVSSASIFISKVQRRARVILFMFEFSSSTG